MSKEVVSLADILTIEDMRALWNCDLSPEMIIETFLEDPRIAGIEYNKEEGRFYVTAADGETSSFRIFSANKETS